MFGRSKKVEAESPQFAPNTEIPYSADLIQRFKGHHASLVKTFGSIRSFAAANDFAGAGKSLATFRQILMAHLLEENVKLYTYLGKCLAHDKDNRALMISMKSDMDKIGGAVMRFLNGYIESGVTPKTKIGFIQELDKIGSVLTQRIENEESMLYTMYLPPSAY